MTTTGWRYTLQDGRKGTLVGPDLDTKEAALWELKHRFGASTGVQELRRSGESEETPQTRHGRN